MQIRGNNMKNQTTVTASGGIGFTGVLTIAFIVLKLTKVISWSWWWVLSPMWISFGIGVIYIAAILVSVILIYRKR